MYQVALKSFRKKGCCHCDCILIVVPREIGAILRWIFFSTFRRLVRGLVWFVIVKMFLHDQDFISRVYSQERPLLLFDSRYDEIEDYPYNPPPKDLQGGKGGRMIGHFTQVRVTLRPRSQLIYIEFRPKKQLGYRKWTEQFVWEWARLGVSFLEG